METNETQIAIIEKAIQLQQKITFKYKTQTSKRATNTTTMPLGLLGFGRFGYLVCLGMSEKPIIYRLNLLQDVKETDEIAVRPLEFNFKKWCAESFGIYHGTNFEKEFQESKSVIIKSKITCYKNKTHNVYDLIMNFYNKEQTNPPKTNFLREHLNSSVTSNDMGWKPRSCESSYFKLCKLVCKRYFNID